jgi:hypothetical protein
MIGHGGSSGGLALGAIVASSGSRGGSADIARLIFVHSTGVAIPGIG